MSVRSLSKEAHGKNLSLLAKELMLWMQANCNVPGIAPEHNFCDLNWSAKCVEFHKSKNSVSTASLAQVRQPIYKTSVASWKNYSSFLEDLKNTLKK